MRGKLLFKKYCPFLSALFIMVGCTYRDSVTYHLWQDTGKEEYVLVPKSHITLNQLAEMRQQGIRFYQHTDDEYFIERKRSTGSIVMEYSFKSLATPVTLAIDGTILYAYIALSNVQVSK